MSRICQICGKGSIKSNLVPRGIGNRVTRRTTIRKMANLRSKRFEVNGSFIRLTLCAGCLKRFKKESSKNQLAVVSK